MDFVPQSQQKHKFKGPFRERQVEKRSKMWRSVSIIKTPNGCSRRRRNSWKSNYWICLSLQRLTEGKKHKKQSRKMIFTQAQRESRISTSLPLRANPITADLCWFIFVILPLVTGDAQPSFTLLTLQESSTSYKNRHRFPQQRKAVDGCCSLTLD